MPPAKTYSIDKDTLEALRLKGHRSEVLEARLSMASIQTILQNYIEPMVGLDRVHPRMLPTQASGRWSTTDPALVNLTADKKYGPHGIRDVVVPDPGTWWLHFDWDAVEARITAAYCGDVEDIEAFNRGYEIHTLTACGMFGWPKPDFEPTKVNIFKSEQGLRWREYITSKWKLPYLYDGECRARRLAKNCRYALAYGVDEKAMIRYAVEMNMEPAELMEAGKLYLRSKPLLVAWKKRRWAEIGKTRVARTFLGRRRVCLGPYNKSQPVQEYAKQGLNHEVQGSVSDVMNDTIIQVTDRWPECWLVLNKHDGAYFGFPRNTDPFPAISAIVEREWRIGGRLMRFTAEYDRILPPGEDYAEG